MTVLELWGKQLERTLSNSFKNPLGGPWSNIFRQKLTWNRTRACIIEVVGEILEELGVEPKEPCEDAHKIGQKPSYVKIDI